MFVVLDINVCCDGSLFCCAGYVMLDINNIC